MATYYVDSNATGLNDGSSWTDAWTSISSATSAVGGDIVLLASNHNEVYSGTLTVTFPATPNTSPVRIISADTSTNLRSNGATITTSGNGSLNLQGCFVYYGVTFVSSWSYTITNQGGVSEFYECRFEGLSGGGAPFYSQGVAITNSYYYGIVVFDSCIFDFTNTYANFDIYRRITAETGKAVVKNCTFVNPAISNSTFRLSGWQSYSAFDIINTDLSSLASQFADSTKQSFDIKVIGCNLPSNYSVGSIANPCGNIYLENCSVGSISSPSTGIEKHSRQGIQTTSTSEYRSNGASDGSSNFSLSLETNANAQEGDTVGSLESTVISKYVNAASQTITVYIAGSASLNDDDFWIEVESPSELVSPTAQGKFRTTKPEPLATPTALASDTSTWTGTGVGTVQKIEVPISPTVAGTVTVRCHLAKPSTTVYVDPKLSNTGYQRVYNGVLVDDNETIITTTTSTAGTQIYPFRQFVSDKFGAVLHPLRSN